MSSKQLDRIRADFKTWARRRPERSAAGARARVLASIDETRKQARWRPAAAATLVVAGLTMAALLVVSGVPSDGPLDDRLNSEPAASAASEHAAQPLLIYELRSGTKLYLALARHAQAVATENHERKQGDES